ncbi:MAG TPA: ATP-binding SpoIIE family protein phosphatase [Capsulimonadaceae bacterium]|jgi:anti-sigma regulatory factor (Ser/Thr protein kinase)
MEVAPGTATSIKVTVEDSSQVGESRRVAATLVREMPFDDVKRGNVALVVTELASNLVSHAGGGEIVLNVLNDGQVRGIEIISIDKGPGIRDINKSSADGYSTAGTAGNGLGAIKRLSTEFDVYSPTNRGLIVFSRIYDCDRPKRAIHARGICLPMRGETQCGDTWSLLSTANGARISVADGLGHGPAAHDAAASAVEGIARSLGATPEEALDHAHEAARGTRGCVMAVADIALSAGDVQYAAIGNISATIVDGPKLVSMASMNGTIGLTGHKPRGFQYPWSESAILIMHSDGLQTNWQLSNYRGLANRDPIIIAAVLYRDFDRRRDDVTVIVAKQPGNH